MRRFWTQEEKQYVKDHYVDGDLNEMAKMFDCNVVQIRSLAKKLGVRRLLRRVWTEERDKVLRELFPNYTNLEISKIMGLTEGAVMARGFELGLRKSRELILRHAQKGFFKKGSVPHNKGKKMNEYLSPETIEHIKETQFKKGHIPENAKSVGEEVVNSWGYTLVKAEGERKLRSKHVVLWEKAHGPVPKECMIVFKDGDKTNVKLENLEMITRKENMLRNSYLNYPPEIQESIRLIGRLNKTINKIIKDDRTRDCK